MAEYFIGFSGGFLAGVALMVLVVALVSAKLQKNQKK